MVAKVQLVHTAKNNLFNKHSVLSCKVDLRNVTSINGIATEGSEGYYIKRFSLYYTKENVWSTNIKKFYSKGSAVGIFCIQNFFVEKR